MPNVFLIDIAPKDRDAVMALVGQQRGLDEAPEVIGTVAGKLIAVDGRLIEDMAAKGYARRFRRPRPVMSAGTLPDYIDVVRGKWWSSPLQNQIPEVCVDQDSARTLSLNPGSMTRWMISGQEFAARVTCLYEVDSVHLASRVEFIFSRGALDGFPLIYYASMRAQPAAVPPLEVALYSRFPTISVVNMADVLQTMQSVVDKIAQVVRFISLFAILAGAVILSSSVAGTRFRRIREVVILKTLGATRGRVSRIFSVEFLVLGAVAGVMGTLLADGFANLLLKHFLDADVSWPLVPSLIAVAATALIANAAGWMASFRILGQKPLEILREE